MDGGVGKGHIILTCMYGIICEVPLTPGAVTWFSVVGFPDGLSFQGYTVSRALTSCCAVALAQHSGQNSRSAQQPPQGWLPLAQHAILGAQHFFAAGLFFLLRPFFSP